MMSSIRPVLKLMAHEGVLAREIDEAERKAIDALARYKFAMFGYWAGIWVHLNKIEGKKRPNPFKHIVLAARKGSDHGN